jgi:DNA primase
MDSTTKWFNYLHLERRLSVDVISEAKLSVVRDRLSIPIIDKDGKRLFSKYRKEPWDTSNSPKYLYEKGGTVSLYGIHYKNRSKELFVTEGEFDVMAICTTGYNAVTSTGGTLSWQVDWKLDCIPTLLLDNDEAGIKGTIRTALILKKCIISWVPSGFGKDVSDVLKDRGKDFLKKMIEDPTRKIKFDITEVTTRKTIIEKKKELQLLAKSMDDCPGKLIIQGLAKKMIELEQSFKKHAPKKYTDDGTHKLSIERARQYPIDQLLQVVHGMAKCPFHKDGQERTPSFHIMADNRGFCFGGCEDRKPKDVIDVYMKLYSCDLKTAVQNLSHS